MPQLITIKAEVRQATGIKGGDHVDFGIEDNQLYFEKTANGYKVSRNHQISIPEKYLRMLRTAERRMIGVTEIKNGRVYLGQITATGNLEELSKPAKRAKEIKRQLADNPPEIQPKPSQSRPSDEQPPERTVNIPKIDKVSVLATEKTPKGSEVARKPSENLTDNIDEELTGRLLNGTYSNKALGDYLIEYGEKLRNLEKTRFKALFILEFDDANNKKLFDNKIIAINSLTAALAESAAAQDGDSAERQEKQSANPPESESSTAKVSIPGSGTEKDSTTEPTIIDEPAVERTEDVSEPEPTQKTVVVDKIPELKLVGDQTQDHYVFYRDEEKNLCRTSVKAMDVRDAVYIAQNILRVPYLVSTKVNDLHHPKKVGRYTSEYEY